MIPVLIPWRHEEYRADLKAWVYQRFWQPLEVDGRFKVIEGYSPEGPFNRSAALNHAARQARDLADWDIAVIADADSWVPRPQLLHAVSEAAASRMLTAAFDVALELTRDATAALMSTGHLDFMEHGVDMVRTLERPWGVQSRMLVCPREVWTATRGFDENFVGWGGQDIAFWRAASIVAGGARRVSGPCFHMWHPLASDPQTRAQDPAWRSNRQRLEQYKQASDRTDLERLWSGPR